jgi:two-component system sensor kinase FixL
MLESVSPQSESLQVPGWSIDAIFNSSDEDRLPVLIGSLGMCAAIAVVDWRVLPNLSLGLLYVLPILASALVLTRPQVGLLAAGCSLLREAYSGFAWTPDWQFRLMVVWAAFFGAGLFVSEYRRNRLQRLYYKQAMAAESGKRREQEQLLRAIVDTSPLAIMVFDPQGRVELANQAAHRMFGLDPEKDMGKATAADLVPTLDRAMGAAYAGHTLRAAIECRARTCSGELFLANVWFSSIDGPAGRRLAAVLWDQSENFRSRESATWETLVDSTRIALGSALHELRNYSRQAAEVHARLMRRAGLMDPSELKALGTVVQGIEEIASSGLRAAIAESRETADLGLILEEVRILVGPTMDEEGITFTVVAPPELPLARVGRQALLQVLLNLLRNARHELEGRGGGEVRIEVCPSDRLILIQVSNSGAPVADPARLFRAFASSGDSSGLGLFVSRALMRSCGGDLRYETRDGRPCFIVELVPNEAQA